MKFLGFVAVLAVAGAVRIEKTPTVVTTAHHTQVENAVLHSEAAQAILSLTPPATEAQKKAHKEAMKEEHEKTEAEQIAGAKQRIEILNKILGHPVMKDPKHPCVYDELLKHPAAKAFMHAHAHSIVHPTHANILKSILAHVDPHHAQHPETTHQILEAVMTKLGHAQVAKAHGHDLSQHTLEELHTLLDKWHTEQQAAHHFAVHHNHFQHHLAPHTNSAAHQLGYKEVTSAAAFNKHSHHSTHHVITRGDRVHNVHHSFHHVDHGLHDHDYFSYEEATHTDPCHGPHPYIKACDCKKGYKNFPKCLTEVPQKVPIDNTESVPVKGAIPSHALEPGQHAAVHGQGIHAKGHFVVNPLTNQPEFVPAGGHPSTTKAAATVSSVSARLHHLATAAAAAAHTDGYVVVVDDAATR